MGRGAQTWDGQEGVGERPLLYKKLKKSNQAVEELAKPGLTTWRSLDIESRPRQLEAGKSRRGAGWRFSQEERVATPLKHKPRWWRYSTTISNLIELILAPTATTTTTMTITTTMTTTTAMRRSLTLLSLPSSWRSTEAIAERMSSRYPKNSPSNTRRRTYDTKMTTILVIMAIAARRTWLAQWGAPLP